MLGDDWGPVLKKFGQRLVQMVLDQLLEFLGQALVCLDAAARGRCEEFDVVVGSNITKGTRRARRDATGHGMRRVICLLSELRLLGLLVILLGILVIGPLLVGFGDFGCS